MGVEIGGIIEEMHEDEEGRRVIDKVKIEHISLVPEDEVVDALEGDDKGAKNTDVEIWRKIPDDYYSPSIHVTKQGDIGINVGGYVLAAPVERWFAAGETANRMGHFCDETVGPKARDKLYDDYIVQMPPIREYTVRARVKSVGKATPPVAVLEDEVKDAMEICGCGLAKEMCCWDELSDDALVEFEKLVDESAYGQPHLPDKLRFWTFDDWIDYFMGR